MHADLTATKNICFLAYFLQLGKTNPYQGIKKSRSQAHCNHDTTKGQGTDEYVFYDPFTTRVNDGVL